MVAVNVLGLKVTSIKVSPLKAAFASKPSLLSESTPKNKTVKGSVKLLVEVKSSLSSVFISLEYSFKISVSLAMF